MATVFKLVLKLILKRDLRQIKVVFLGLPVYKVLEWIGRVEYSSLLICNRAATNRHVKGNPPVLVHLDRVFTKVPIAVIIWTVFLQKYPLWLYFLAVLGPCFSQVSMVVLLIGQCFYNNDRCGY